MKLVIFDLDRTLVSNNCSFAFYANLVSRGIFPRISLVYALLYYVRYTYFGMSLRALHSHIFARLLRGLSLKTLEDEVDAFLDRYLETHLYPPVISRLKQAQKQGDYVVILSNSPSFLVKKVAQKLGVTTSRSSEYAVDTQGKLCHIAFVMQGEDKALIAEQLAAQWKIPRSDIVAYSDSILDAPLLLCAGQAIGVKPDRLLRRLCAQHRWPIL